MTKELAEKTTYDIAQYAGSQANDGTDDLYLPTAFIGQPQNELVVDGQLPQGCVANSLTDEVIIKPGESARFIPLMKYTEYAYHPSEAEKKEGNLGWLTRDPNQQVIVGEWQGTAAEAVQWRASDKPLAEKSLVFLVVFESDLEMPVIVKFKRTNFTAGKKLNTLLRVSKDPRFFTKTFEMSLVKKKGDQGQWYNYEIKPAGATKEEVVDQMTALFDNYRGLRDGYSAASDAE